MTSQLLWVTWNLGLHEWNFKAPCVYLLIKPCRKCEVWKLCHDVRNHTIYHFSTSAPPQPWQWGAAARFSVGHHDSCEAQMLKKKKKWRLSSRQHRLLVVIFSVRAFCACVRERDRRRQCFFFVVVFQEHQNIQSVCSDAETERLSNTYSAECGWQW